MRPHEHRGGISSLQQGTCRVLRPVSARRCIPAGKNRRQAVHAHATEDVEPFSAILDDVQHAKNGQTLADGGPLAGKGAGDIGDASLSPERNSTMTKRTG